MSYEIYKSIKQLDDGRFECISASSNCTNMNGGRDFSHWVMDYFNNEFPSATNKEKRACWILYSTYCSDVFYQSYWKKDQELAHKFLKDNGYADSIFHKTNKDLWLDAAREFLKYKTNLSLVKKKSFIVSMYFNSGKHYVGRLNRKTCSATFSKESAKIFKAYDIKEIEDKFKGYAQYSPTVEEI